MTYEHLPEERKYFPPILALTPSAMLYPDDYIELGTLGNFGKNMRDGFCILVDVQCDNTTEQVLLGCIQSNGSKIAIHMNHKNILNRLNIYIADKNDRELQAYVQLSHKASKRLFINVATALNQITVIEININSIFYPETIYINKGTPVDFDDFEYPIFVGGMNIDGCRHGYFQGRCSGLVIVARVLEEAELKKLQESSISEIGFHYGVRRDKLQSQELGQLFIDDVAKLRQWIKPSSLSNAETRDASTLIFRWLFDKHPLLQELCDELGVQLSLIGRSDDHNNYVQNMIKMGASMYQIGYLGKNGPFRFKWVSLDVFKNQTLFINKGNIVTISQFVKFVRNKLGGSHFDEKDRTKWQIDLKSISDITFWYGANAINHHMQELARIILQCVEECGVETQLFIQKSLRGGETK